MPRTPRNYYHVTEINWNPRETHAVGTTVCPTLHTGGEMWCLYLRDNLNDGYTFEEAVADATHWAENAKPVSDNLAYARAAAASVVA